MVAVRSVRNSCTSTTTGTTTARTSCGRYLREVPVERVEAADRRARRPPRADRPVAGSAADRVARCTSWRRSCDFTVADGALRSDFLRP